MIALSTSYIYHDNKLKSNVMVGFANEMKENEVIHWLYCSHST